MPRSIHGGCELVVLDCRHLVHGRLEDGSSSSEVRGGDRQRPLLLEGPEETSLNFVKEAATCQGIQTLKRLWQLDRLEAIEGAQDELIRARAESLQRR